MLLGKRIKELRLKYGYTQEQLGKLINVTKVSVCCYEKGSRMPTLDTLNDICKVFDVTFNYLFGQDSYVVSESNEECIHLSKEEVTFIKEVRNYPNIYSKVIDDPKRIVEFIDHKMR